MTTCWSCRGKVINVKRNVSRSDLCPTCGKSLRCCKNCELHKVGLYNDCREPKAERVGDKEKSNFCEYFKYKTSPRDPHVHQRGRPVRNTVLDSIFKPLGPGDVADSAPAVATAAASSPAIGASPPAAPSVSATEAFKTLFKTGPEPDSPSPN